MCCYYVNGVGTLAVQLNFRNTQILLYISFTYSTCDGGFGILLHISSVHSCRSKSGVEPACSSQAGVVTLLHDIIISGDDQTRQWFAQYLKCMQQKVSPA